MPPRHQIAAHFNEKEWEKIKKVQGTKTEYKFIREVVLEYVREAEREAMAGRDQGNSPRGTEATEVFPPFIVREVITRPETRGKTS